MPGSLRLFGRESIGSLFEQALWRAGSSIFIPRRDEAGRGEHGSFTGAFVDMAAFDTSGSGKPADFDYFSYRPAEGG